jgi:ElaB/YqjD/DUF883 family membrane-anchored ribosome-binding protein
MAETAQTGGYGRPASSSGSGDATDVKGQAQEKAQEVKEQATQQAQQVAGQAKGRARTEIDNRSTQLGQQISQQASDLRSVSDQLRSQGKEGPAKVADQVAERAERAGGWLTQADGEQILHEVEDFGRRNPWAVMAGGAAVGFLASRFLKASSQDRYQRRGMYTTGPTYGNRSLPEHTGTGYRTETGDRFTRNPGGSIVPEPPEPPAPPAGMGGTSSY